MDVKIRNESALKVKIRCGLHDRRQNVGIGILFNPLYIEG